MDHVSKKWLRVPPLPSSTKRGILQMPGLLGSISEWVWLSNSFMSEKLFLRQMMIYSLKYLFWPALYTSRSFIHLLGNRIAMLLLC